MSEEMNLYKRCKNIFKAHGVDMGGGGSGGSVVYIDVLVDTSTGEATSDVTLFDIQAAFNSGASVIAKLGYEGGLSGFVPLVSYYETGSDSPYMAAFGYFVYNAEVERNVPALQAVLGEDGNTNWTMNG